jgi:hypothetical protein
MDESLEGKKHDHHWRFQVPSRAESRYVEHAFLFSRHSPNQVFPFAQYYLTLGQSYYVSCESHMFFLGVQRHSNRVADIKLK